MEWTVGFLADELFEAGSDNSRDLLLTSGVPTNEAITSSSESAPSSIRLRLFELDAQVPALFPGATDLLSCLPQREVLSSEQIWGSSPSNLQNVRDAIKKFEKDEFSSRKYGCWLNQYLLSKPGATILVVDETLKIGRTSERRRLFRDAVIWKTSVVDAVSKHR